MNASSFDYLVKILMIGDSGVGKTCILQKFEDNECSMNHLPTIAIDFSIKTIVVAGKSIKMQIWDTAGQERYNSLTEGFFKMTQCILICFSLVDRASFESVGRWMTQVNRLSPKNAVVILVGNKKDLAQERRVTAEEALELARNFSVDYFETSAVTGEEIERLFASAGEKLLVALEKESVESGDALDAEGRASRDGCCLSS